MFLSFNIARRYLFAKKRTNAINIISAISVVGVVVATMALVVVLSVFNGFHDLVASLFTSFDPQIEVVPAKGKSIAADIPELQKIRELPDIDVATDCVEDQAMVVFHDRQAMVKIKGVDDNFQYQTNIQSILKPDNPVFTLHAADLQYGIPGIRLAGELGCGAFWSDHHNQWGQPDELYVYAPQREGQVDMSDPESAFVMDSLMSSGSVFEVRQSRYDANVILTSIDFARNLFSRQGEVTSVLLRFKGGTDLSMAKGEVKAIAGDKLLVKDRFEQQEDTFRIMSIEKMLAYVFLTFILVIVTFNIIGSLSMLIIDKQDDVRTLRHLGASDSLIRRIFFLEGGMISVFGAVIGVGLGLLLCWLQQEFGLVRMGSSSGSFIVDAYPLSVHYTDVTIVFFTVIIVGFASIWYPVRYIVKKFIK